MNAPFVCLFILVFLINSLGPVPSLRAEGVSLPLPQARVSLSQKFNPALLKGIKVHPRNPFQFDFILDPGQANPHQLKEEANKLIRYFLASLTISENDLWVNLSPYEKDRIIPEAFGVTEMGRDLLAQDYMLKQVTASLMYPEEDVGKTFWKNVYEKAAHELKTTDVPINTFNKVWIVPEKAVVYENAKTGTAYVVESKLKVMLEEDYKATANQGTGSNYDSSGGAAIIGACPQAGCQARNDGPRQAPQVKNQLPNELTSQILRQIILPELTKEINEGKNFAKLRQVYNSLILATWFKTKLKETIFSKGYADQNKMAGISLSAKEDKQIIYERYLQAFKKGAYNYIKEEQDPLTHKMIPRKYFSGGMHFKASKAMIVQNSNLDPAQLITAPILIESRFNPVSEAPPDAAMLNDLNDNERQELRHVIHNVFLDMNKMTETRTPPFIFNNHGFFPFDHIHGGIKMFALLKSALLTSAFKARAPKLYDQLTNGHKPTLEDFKQLVRFAGARSSNFIALDKSDKEYLIDFLCRSGFVFDPQLVTDETVKNIWRFLKNENYAWPLQTNINDMDLHKFMNEVIITHNLNQPLVGNIKYMITNQEALQIIDFLRVQQLINDEEFIQLTKSWKELFKVYRQIFDKMITNIDQSTEKPYIDNSDLSESLRKKLWPNIRMELQTQGLSGQLLDDTERKMLIDSMDMFILQHNKNAQIVYPILLNVFKRLIEKTVSAPRFVEERNLGNGFKLGSLKEGYFEDANHFMWVLESAPSENSVFVITYEGSQNQLEEIFAANPSKMFEIFYEAASLGAMPDEKILNAMRRWNGDLTQGQLEECGKYFVDMLSGKGRVSRIILFMQEVGLLGKFMPQLASLDSFFVAGFHRYTVTTHSIFLLDVLENMEGWLAQAPAFKMPSQTQDVLDQLKNSNNSDYRLALRLAMLLHDAHKETEADYLSQPHPLGGAYTVVPEVLANLPHTDNIRVLIQWLVRYHQELSSKAGTTPREQKFAHSDLLDIIKLGGNILNKETWQLLVLLTWADSLAVEPEPRKAKAYLRGQSFNTIAVFNQKMIEYFQSPSKEEVIALWQKLAQEEDETYLAKRIAQILGDGVDSTTNLPTYLSSDIKALPVSETEKQALRDYVFDPMRLAELIDEYAKLFPASYYRQLHSTHILNQIVHFALFSLRANQRQELTAQASVTTLKTGYGKMLEFLVFVNKDTRGIMYKIMGIMAAMGVNIMDAEMNTTKKGIVFDRMHGYFIKGGPTPQMAWQALKELCRSKGVPLESSIIDEKNVDWNDVLPFMFDLVIKDQITVDEVFNLKGAVKEFKKTLDGNDKVMVKFGADGQINSITVSELNLESSDRNGLAYIVSRILAERFEVNIELAPISTLQLGASDRLLLSKEDGRALNLKEKLEIESYLADLLNKDVITAEDVRQSSTKNEAMTVGEQVKDAAAKFNLSVKVSQEQPSVLMTIQNLGPNENIRERLTQFFKALNEKLDADVQVNAVYKDLDLSNQMAALVMEGVKDAIKNYWADLYNMPKASGVKVLPKLEKEGQYSLIFSFKKMSQESIDEIEAGIQKMLSEQTAAIRDAFLELSVSPERGAQELNSLMKGMTANTRVMRMNSDYWVQLDPNSLDIRGDLNEKTIKAIYEKIKSTWMRKGGIDLTAQRMDLQVKGQEEKWHFPVDPAMLAQAELAAGFTSEIISMKPLDNLAQFLGLPSVQ